MIIGVDPGGTGALVALDANGELIDTLLMPTLKVGTKTGINGAAIQAWLVKLKALAACAPFNDVKCHAFIELVNAMPSGPPGAKRAMGVGSAFSFGKAAGLVEGVIQGACIPHTLVTPQAWKKHAGLIGSDKDAARSRAIQLYPSCRILDLKGKGQAVADAILIARYGLFRESPGSI
jgi:crossover junction endodeoxyribonuclease RuvC